MSLNLEHAKQTDQRVVYRLILTEAKGESGRRVECTYFDGTRIHGKKSSMKHPSIVVSASDQDEVLWVAKYPFEINLKNGNPFYRPIPWKAVEGKDNLWRVASGPADPALVKNGPEEHHFSATRLLETNLQPDPDCEILDPHIIVEP